MTLDISKTSIKDIKEGKKYNQDVFYLNDIPTAMKEMGWNVAANLMNRWFNAKAYVMTDEIRTNIESSRKINSDRYDDQTIKIEWAKKFDSTSSAFEITKKHWKDDNSIGFIRKILSRNGWKSGSVTPIYIGSELMNAYELNILGSIKNTSFGLAFDTIDELRGALGKATLKLSIVGHSEYIKKDIFIVKKLGLYIRDNYEFSGDSEFLGVWSKKRVLSKAETTQYMALYYTGAFRKLNQLYPGFVPVFNKDFSTWRENHLIEKKESGGDFVVFSDVEWFEPQKTDAMIEL